MGLIALLFLRAALPITLAVCSCLRRNFLSLAYLLLLVISPFIKLPSSSNTAPTNGYLLAIILISGLMIVGQICFQIALVAMTSYGHTLVNCGFMETLFRHIGFVKLNQVTTVTAVRLVIPDVVVLVCSLMTYFVVQAVTRREFEDEETDLFSTYRRHFALVGKYVSLLLLVCSAAIQPSILGAVYFVIFLGAMNWWTFQRRLGPAFTYALMVAKWLMALQLCAMFVVQWQYIQDVVDQPDNLYFRIIGLTVLVTSNCSNPQQDQYLYADWDYYMSPILLMISFNILTITVRLVPNYSLSVETVFEQFDEEGTSHVAVDIEDEELEENEGMKDSEQQLVVNDIQTPEDWHDDDIQLLVNNEVQMLPVRFTDLFHAVKHMLVQNAYVVASFAMMAWSITDHSWVTFVLLLWVCLAWIMPPNQRTNLLYTSPFLVLYAQLLLIAQYIYSMDLTDDELPQYAIGVNIVQLGFRKYPSFPLWQILLQCLYTCTFWIILQQFIHRGEKKKIDDRESLSEHYNPLVHAVGEIVMYAFAKYWIWLAGAFWFAIGLTQKEITAECVVYLGLFHLYILNFQLAYALWRRVLSTFWLLVVLYSLLVLILKYTFQFDNFPYWWEAYIKVPPHVQHYIGLRQYESTHDMVLSLLPVVFFIAVAVIYVDLFHAQFLAITDPEKIAEFRDSEGVSADAEESKVIALPSELTTGIEPVSFSTFMVQVWHSMRHHYSIFVELFWRFLKLYLVKIALLSIGAMCVYDVCPPHFVLLVVAILALLCGRRFHMLAIDTVAVGVAICMMARFVYQISYFNHNYFNVSCLDEDGNELFPDVNMNDADWLGLHKLNTEKSFEDLFSGYIGLIVIFVLLSCAFYRLAYIRVYKKVITGKEHKPVTIMFPEVNRANADKNLGNFIKYIVNYGFYKFGVEMCFVAMAILMAVRLDVYAVLYGTWLFFMVFMSRRVLHWIWLPFILFSAILIPVQYIISVGFPHSLCTIYPWRESEMLRRIQDWFYLPGSAVVPPSYRFMCDFVVLLFSCHQYYVFLIEAREEEMPYEGGSNKDITDDLDNPDFQNPIPDFFPVSQCWLDSFKRMSSQLLLWLALSLVFFAGVNRVNIFSFGYLGLTFFYLWYGEQLYLLPARTIIWRWNVLLTYNLAVMMIKMVLQIIGCVFVSRIMETACWAIELLGISCLMKSLRITAASVGSGECPLPESFAGLWWDVVCFTALIFTRRFFGSCYFLHLVNDTKVMMALSDRGANLFAKYEERKADKKWDQDKANFERIKRNMQRIIERQKRIQGPRYRKLLWHHEVIRAGDYYMFETIDDVELEEEDVQEEEILLKPKTEDMLKDALQQASIEAEALDISVFADVPTSEDKSIPESKETKSRRSLLWTVMKFCWALLDSMMISLTVFLYKSSNNYLYVFQILEWKKNVLKADHEFLVGTYDENGLWHPAKAAEEYLKHATNQPEEPEDDDPHFWLHETDSTIVLLLTALYYAFVSHLQYVCYFIIFLIQMKSASLLSLPLPIAVFVWALFARPQPAKTFWVTIIMYTKVIIVVKFIFQFEFIQPYDDTPDDLPFEPVIIIGIQRFSNYATYELVLLLFVYFHRLTLKSMGLWERRRDEKSTKDSAQSQLWFFDRLSMSRVRVPADVYTCMFICSFINFFVLLFGFLSFGVDQPDSNLIMMIERNRVPLQLVIILLLQFIIIIVDRCIYLTRAVRTRIVVHFSLVFLIHLWLFFILPATTNRPFYSSVYPQVFYVIQGAYFIFSAYQIRCGFPLRVLGNIICSDYRLLNYTLFKVFLHIPFLAEIRGIMDWMFMTTSMKLMTFLTMESIFYHVFQVKCRKTLTATLGHPASTQLHPHVKWWCGGSILVIIFAIIWCPLYLYTIGMAAGSANIPYSFSLTIEVAGHTPLYRALVQSTQIFGLTFEQWEDFNNLYQNNRRAASFLRNYDFQDVAVITIDSHSTAVWEASPVDQNLMMHIVQNTSEPLTFTVTWQVTRISRDTTFSGISVGHRTWVLEGGDVENRDILSSVMAYNTTVPFPIPRMIPKFIEVTNQDTVHPVLYLLPGSESMEDAFRDIELRLHLDDVTMQDWWEMREVNCSTPSPELLQQLPFYDPMCRNVLIYTFNEKMLPLTLTRIISGRGVTALYITGVYVISQLIRSYTISSVSAIMFKDMPIIDRVLQLCLNIYLAREYGELALEEYLYSQLLFLFRSPETLIRWSRRPEPGEEI